MQGESKSEGGEIEELATIELTDEQRSAIERVTGVAVKEMSILEHTGSSARQLASSLLKAADVALCW